jgi:hypothetical protein
MLWRADRYVNARASLQLRLLRLGLLQDGDVGVGVFPEGEEVFVGGECPNAGGLAFRLSQSSNGDRQYFIFVKSSISPGPVGCQPRALRVHSLEAGMSSVAKRASHPKRSPACSGGMDFTDIFSPLPIVQTDRGLARHTRSDASRHRRHRICTGCARSQSNGPHIPQGD